jgi:hypothetical protein
MSVVHLTNLPASVKQRLMNLSRETRVEFNVLLTKYALERFLYRMSVRGEDLSQALIATFERQKTPIPWRTPRGLSADFAVDPMKRAQWNHFLIQTNAISLEKNFAEGGEGGVFRSDLATRRTVAASGERP